MQTPAEVREAFRRWLGNEDYTRFLRVICTYAIYASSLRFWQMKRWSEFAEQNAMTLTEQEVLHLFRVCHVHEVELTHERIASDCPPHGTHYSILPDPLMPVLASSSFPIPEATPHQAASQQLTRSLWARSHTSGTPGRVIAARKRKPGGAPNHFATTSSGPTAP